MPLLKYWVDPALQDYERLAAASLSQLLEVGGWQSQATADFSTADIVYSPSADLPNSIPCADIHAWRAVERQRPSRCGDLVVPEAAVITKPGSKAHVDPVLAAYFFLSGRVEQDGHPRTFAGILEQDSVSQWGLATMPIIQKLIAGIKNRIRISEQPHRPWPQEKKWAMCLTHDCDRILRFDTPAFARDALHGANPRAGRMVSAAKAAYSFVRSGFTTDPYIVSYKAWLRFERSLGVNAVYFIGTRSRHEEAAGPHDLPYTPMNKEVLDLVHACCETGAEIGLHSSTVAWRDALGYTEEVQRFSRNYGVSPVGLRGHYWSLNPRDPEESLAYAANAGMKYDASFGMNVAYGFRRGTCYPFRPFHSSTGRFSGLWELPTTVMDGALFLSAKDNASRVANFLTLAETVRRNNGVLVLDWHSDSLWPGFMENMTQSLLPAISELASDSSCWVATGQEIVKWCAVDRWSGAP